MDAASAAQGPWNATTSENRPNPASVPSESAQSSTAAQDSSGADSSTAASGNSEHETLTVYPIISTEVKRYERNISIPLRDRTKSITIEPMSVSFERVSIANDWVLCIHPEGALYYYHEKRRLYTDAHLTDPTTFARLEKFADQLLLEAAKHNNHTLLADSDAVLELYEDDANLCGYYFVHHTTRTLFWLEKYDINYDVQEVKGEISNTHIRLILAFANHYTAICRRHIMNFPHNPRLLHGTAVGQLKSMLTWAMTDQVTSSTSVCPWTPGNLSHLISVTTSLESLQDKDCVMAIVGRLLQDFCRSRYLHYYGEHGARLNATQSVHSQVQPRRSSFMTLLFFLLFNAPITHLDGINSVYTDELVSTLTWKSHVDKLKSDWQEYILYSTVLLNANVAYLAIPNIIQNGVTGNTVGQVASYLSVLTSIGSVIVGLLLMRQHRINPLEDDATEAVSYLYKFSKRAGGLEKLAILYSVPYALLMWAMIGFLAAICFECFNNTDIPTLTLTVTVSFLIVALSFWCAYSGSQHSETTKAFFQTSWQRSVQPIKTLKGKVSGLLSRGHCQEGKESQEDTGAGDQSVDVDEKDVPGSQV